MTDRDDTKIDMLVARTRKFIAENVGLDTLHLLGRILVNSETDLVSDVDLYGLTLDEDRADDAFFDKLDTFLSENIGPDWAETEAL